MEVKAVNEQRPDHLALSSCANKCDPEQTPAVTPFTDSLWRVAFNTTVALTAAHPQVPNHADRLSASVHPMRSAEGEADLLPAPIMEQKHLNLGAPQAQPESRDERGLQQLSGAT